MSEVDDHPVPFPSLLSFPFPARGCRFSFCGASKFFLPSERKDLSTLDNDDGFSSPLFPSPFSFPFLLTESCSTIDPLFTRLYPLSHPPPCAISRGTRPPPADAKAVSSLSFLFSFASRTGFFRDSCPLFSARRGRPSPGGDQLLIPPFPRRLGDSHRFLKL